MIIEGFGHSSLENQGVSTGFTTLYHIIANPRKYKPTIIILRTILVNYCSVPFYSFGGNNGMMLGNCLR